MYFWQRLIWCNSIRRRTKWPVEIPGRKVCNGNPPQLFRGYRIKGRKLLLLCLGYAEGSQLSCIIGQTVAIAIYIRMTSAKAQNVDHTAIL